MTIVDVGGYRWFQWEEHGARIIVTDATDAEAVVEGFGLRREGRAVDIVLGPMPDGWEVLDGPSLARVGPRPGVSTDSGTELGIDLYVSDALELGPFFDRYDIVSVDGIEGLLGDRDGHTSLVWSIEPGWWASLSARGSDRTRVLEIAEGVDFTDRSSWEERYDTDLDDYRVPPTTVPLDG